MGEGRNVKRLELIIGRSALMQNTLVTSVVVLFVCFASVSVVQTADRQQSPAPNGTEDTLRCYACNSRDSANATVCENGALLQNTNDTSWEIRCGIQHTFCMVSVYKTSSAVNGTAALEESIWSVERRCSEDCDAGCLTVGERTKIIKCVSCCRSNLCNYTDGAATTQQIQQALLWVALLSLWLVVK